MRKLVALVLALCLVFSATCAMAEDWQEIAIGGVTLQIPAGMTGGVYYDDKDYRMESHNYFTDDYTMTITTIDPSALDQCSNLHEIFGNDIANVCFGWALQAVSGAPDETAKIFIETAEDVKIQGRDWKRNGTETIAIFYHYAQEVGVYMILSLNEGTSFPIGALHLVGFDIACSLNEGN